MLKSTTAPPVPVGSKVVSIPTVISPPDVRVWVPTWEPMESSVTVTVTVRVSTAGIVSPVSEALGLIVVDEPMLVIWVVVVAGVRLVEVGSTPSILEIPSRGDAKEVQRAAARSTTKCGSMDSMVVHVVSFCGKKWRVLDCDRQWACPAETMLYLTPRPDNELHLNVMQDAQPKMKILGSEAMFEAGI